MNKKSTLLKPQKNAQTPMPRLSINKFILSYATSLVVIKSKSLGNFDVFMN
ncbi:MAG: hypothetical protein WCP69_04990 [Bacteroidota bacterium]|jgi:hypothetical protein